MLVGVLVAGLAAVGAAGTTARTVRTAAGNDPQPAGIPGSWRLVLDARFDGAALDPHIWRTGWFGSGVTSPVAARETACYSPGNVTLPGDGTLHLDVTASPSTCGGVTEPYTGAIITTNPRDGRPSGGFTFTYGVLEARVYVPADGRLIADWPAVWTDGQSWPQDGEDDILEGLGGHACFHFHDVLGRFGGCARSVSPGWHTFASDWQPGSVTYYYDGVQVGSVTSDVTGAPMFIVIDNTVASGRPGTTAADSLRISYVRVWQS